MTDLSAFGHFFGFTSTINYATSIFTEFSQVLFSMVHQLEVEKLSQEKVKHEQSFPVFSALIEKEIDNEPSEIEKNKLAQFKNNAERALLQAKSAELGTKKFITEIKLDQTYKLNFEKKFKPIFPLAGTYSVIFLLFSSFAEANHNDHVICLNTILFVNAFYIGLCIANYFGFFKIKNKGNDWRTLILSFSLVAFTFLAWLLAFYINSHPELTWFQIHKIQTQLFILSFMLSCSGFIALGIKIGRVNWIAHRKFNEFKAANSITKSYFKKFAIKP